MRKVRNAFLWVIVLAPKGKKCIFVGYNSSTKGYKLFDVDSKKLIVTRDVIFNKKKLHGIIMNKKNRCCH